MAVCQITKALQAKYKSIAQKIIYADVYNLSRQLSGSQPKDEANEQQMMLQAFANLREQGGWVAWQTSSKEEICSLMFKTKEMIDQYQRFGQMIFVDVSVSKKYKPDSDSEEAKEYHILVLSGISSEGSNVLFGCAVLEDLTLPSIAWALNHFSDSNTDPETIIVNFQNDSCVRAVQTIFTNSHVLFCQNSVKTFLSSRFAFLKGQTKKEKFLSKQDMFDMTLDLITEPCPERFNCIADAIFQTANDYLDNDELKLLQQLMFTKEMWSNAYCPNTFTCGTHNLNRALAVSKLLNSKLLRGGATLLDILNLVKNQIELQTAHSATPLSDVQTVYHHPLLRYLRVNLTNFAFQLCLHQYMFSHNLTFSITNKDIQVQSEQITDDVACSCEFYCSHGLPCCHLFAFWNLKQVKSLPSGSIKQRWMRIYGVEEANITSQDFGQQQPQLCHREQYRMVQNIRMQDGQMLYEVLNIQKLSK